MTTERDILQALEGLPTSTLEQVKDFILIPERESHAASSPETESACEEADGSYQKMGWDESRTGIFRQRT